MTISDKTRHHLLDAATDVFAAKGYAKASTREICRRAGANVAAVHYHFGDKKELYREVFRKPFSELAARSGDFASLYPDLPRAIAAFYRGMLEPLTSGQRSCRLIQLHAREQLDPSGVLGDIRPQAFRSQHDQLIRLLCRKFNLARPDLETQRLALAVEGMTLVYCHARELVDSFAPALMRGPDWIERSSVRLAELACSMIDAEARRRLAKKTPARKLSYV